MRLLDCTTPDSTIQILTFDREEMIQRLHALSERAMAQHFSRPTPWGTVSKPGPGHPLAVFAHQLTTSQNLTPLSIRDAFRHIDSIWYWVEDREGLQHPLDLLESADLRKELNKLRVQIKPM